MGDKALDVEAGVRAGLAGAILVLTGYGGKQRPQLAAVPRSSATIIEVARDLGAAAALILGRAAPAD